MIDPEIAEAGLELSAALGRSLRKMLADGGMTPEEIDKTMYKAMDCICIDGVPLHSRPCDHCEGRGWIKT